MSEQIIRATATIPAGTPADAPLTLALTLDNWQIEAVTLEVPPGPSGAMGFYLGNNGNPWVPRVPGEYFVWDDRSETFYADDYPTGQGWEVVGYNTGSYDHSVIVSFHVNATTPTGSQLAQPVLTFIETGVTGRDPVTLP